jgi:hypothetical protein
MVWECTVLAAAARADKEGKTSLVEEEEEKCRGSPGAIEPSIGPSCATATFFLLYNVVCGTVWSTTC